ncbi:DUF6629 family protein [Agrobacterium vitis]|uniref:DUF6629 family protein n=1 Tax=Agrobacterium vitis TaxID=373 RepID=UPI003D2B8C85
MCFSATASFTTVGVTGVIGVAALFRMSRPHDLLLAAVPIIFAIQQSIEGLLWLTLPVAPGGSVATTLTLLFLLFAEVFWPAYVPLAMLFVEPNERRRRLMLPWLAVGLGVAFYLLWGILTHPHGARILDDHIVYVTEHRFSFAVGLAYVGATSAPLMLSSSRAVIILGAVVLTGCLTAYAFYWEAFVSVWCFFAAAASSAILFHFERIRRDRLLTAGA